MFHKLKEKWNVNWLQFTLIFTTFALGGSSCAKLASYILQLFLSEKDFIYWIIYLPMVTILWPICVIIISIPLFQFPFFKNYLKKMWTRIKGSTK
ncbi:MAG TPA: hypothetical protein PLU36_03900 [Chitinophagaceae bacterium]|nr:hypothetical protein [Chitinophagaceae bacterium]MCC6634754.1 hypothetical protein [Chitinophagaceae bacterium]HMZ45924.1 hypothetical protein [Chitinophagaceae bacterium]HNF30230.1 hypothetical protein [Chitinophagaceae bacterium]HNJ57389.1 hypothetical protein [Chitinophagaceae bacterium]